MDLMRMTAEMMPSGKPNFPAVRNYETVAKHIQQHGEGKMMKALVMQVRDFAAGINVVRNISEDQAIEIAFMLMRECGNFRLEDYAMMFDMAKRGELVKIYDRLDITVITEILDKYWLIRNKAGKEEQEREYNQLDGLGSAMRSLDAANPQDVRLLNAADGLAGAMGSLKNAFQEWKNEKPDENKPA